MVRTRLTWERMSRQSPKIASSPTAELDVSRRHAKPETARREHKSFAGSPWQSLALRPVNLQSKRVVQRQTPAPMPGALPANPPAPAVPEEKKEAPAPAPVPAPEEKKTTKKRAPVGTTG